MNTNSSFVSSPAPEGTPIRRWFALRKDLMEQEAFVRLSPCEMVALFDINFRLAEHLSLVRCGFRRGWPFEESDANWAKRLSMSPETFQNARLKIGLPKHKVPKTRGLGWVTYTSGYRTREGSFRRTQYHDARYAEPARGIQSGAMFRDVWQGMVVGLQEDYLRHKDLVVAAFVCYFWKVLGGLEMGSITIYKSQVEIHTGMPAPTFKVSLERLHANSLLNFKDRHKYGFEISKWAGGPDTKPSETHPNPTTEGFIPPNAILGSGMENSLDGSEQVSEQGGLRCREGDRGVDFSIEGRRRPWSQAHARDREMKRGEGV